MYLTSFFDLAVEGSIDPDGKVHINEDNAKFIIIDEEAPTIVAKLDLTIVKRLAYQRKRMWWN